MTEKEIVQKVSEIMGYHFSHYDNHMGSSNYFNFETPSPVKIVCYSGMSPWTFAILEDMSVITSMSRFHDTFLDIAEKMEEIEGLSESLETVKKEVATIKEAEQFLKDNNCSDIINNPDKKINWV